VVIVQGAPEQAEPVSEDPLCRLLKVLLEELPIKQAVKVAANFTHLNKNNLYELALEISSKKRSLHVHLGKEKL
jgi:16S rRNA (cytidine1402-2'-O)-methyltransferase